MCNLTIDKLSLITTSMAGNNSVCGLLCPHPSCWDLNRKSAILTTKSNANKINNEHKQRTPSPEYEKLPTQKIVNLFEEVLPKSEKLSKQPLQSKSYEKLTKRMPVPTPAAEYTDEKVTSIFSEPKKPATTVLIHEVFELSDLQNSVDETFLPTSVLVWKPPRRKKRMKKNKNKSSLVNPIDSLPNRKWPPAPPPQTAFSSRQTTRLNRRFKSSTSQMYRGMDDLLDLPRDILEKVVTYIRPSDLTDRKRLTSRLLTIVPQLEGHSSAVALAASRVLTQHKIRINQLQENNADKQFDSKSVPSPVIQFSPRHSLPNLNVIDPDRTTVPESEVVKLLQKQQEFSKILLDGDCLQFKPKPNNNSITLTIPIKKCAPADVRSIDLDSSTETSLHVFSPETLELPEDKSNYLKPETPFSQYSDETWRNADTEKKITIDSSPLPPPPSPDHLPSSAISTGYNPFLLDSDSFTISARPPTDLDDFSRIQTPKTPFKHNYSVISLVETTATNLVDNILSDAMAKFESMQRK